MFKSIKTISEFLEINSQEFGLILEFKEEEKETVFVKIISGELELSLVIRFSEIDEDFLEICYSEELKEHWQKCFSSMSVVVSEKVVHTPISFYMPFENSVTFQFVKGFFFFDKACDIHELMEGKYSFIEEGFLKKAIQCGSVHALQLYSEQKYKKEVIEQSNNVKEIYKEIIKSCSEMRNTYGSYVLGMLAQAYFLYAIYLNGDKKNMLSKINKHAALIVCDQATTLLSSSEYSIFNASFGQGFRRSNLLNLESPAEMKKYIMGYSLGKN